ncbi:PIH1 domain-containing protein 2 [Lates japonicus]|uniref:PIH1 domain-containing protein 2 n=1 Tax=Lates japonicus TaxID=270547 RepID=A0AAD3N084_LATJO|nr:PIH1 domain-containing protein 2 [Lates japonicus]
MGGGYLSSTVISCSPKVVQMTVTAALLSSLQHLQNTPTHSQTPADLLQQTYRTRLTDKTDPSPSTAARSVELTVELPKVCSMSESQLRISKDDVLLEVEDVYYLLLELPKTVNEDTASAIFNKKKRRLTLKVDIL